LSKDVGTRAGSVSKVDFWLKCLVFKDGGVRSNVAHLRSKARLHDVNDGYKGLCAMNFEAKSADWGLERSREDKHQHACRRLHQHLSAPEGRVDAAGGTEDGIVCVSST
jgi:hypothetical protein